MFYDPRGFRPESMNRDELPAPEGPTINIPFKSEAAKTGEEPLMKRVGHVHARRLQSGDYESWI